MDWRRATRLLGSARRKVLRTFGLHEPRFARVQLPRRAWLLKNATVVTANGGVRLDLAIEDGRVVERFRDRPNEVDLGAHWIFPGLINAHDHFHLNAIPRKAEVVGPFANAYVWSKAWHDKTNGPEVSAAFRVPHVVRLWHGGLKNLLSGATTAHHHDPTHETLKYPNFPVRALADLGWCHSIQGSRDFGPPLESIFSTPQTQRWVIHLAEGTDDVAQHELETLARAGCLDPRTVIVHGVGLMKSDVERALSAGASLVWCPASNMCLFGKSVDPRPWFDAGRLALGTDSRLTGSSDLLEEIRFAAELGHFSPRELFMLVTSMAAAVLGLRELGTLDVGAHADFFVVPKTGEDPHRALISLRRAQIRAVFVGGAPVLADPDLEARLMEHDPQPIIVDGARRVIARAVIGRVDALRLERGVQIF